MSTINIQLDSSETKVVSYFSSPQDPAVWPNQGQIDSTDARWKTYFEAIPVFMQPGLPIPYLLTDEQVQT